MWIMGTPMFRFTIESATPPFKQSFNIDYEIVVYRGSITSRDSYYLPHDSHYDVLTTTLKKGLVNKGEKSYMKSVVIIEGTLYTL